MSTLFLTLLNMSLVSSLLIIALLLLRPLLKKAPKALVCALWSLVGVRLVCPFTFESFLSLIPDSEPISKEVILSQTEYLSALPAEDMWQATNIISNTLASPAGASINPMQAISLVAAFIWAVGVAVMLIISLVSYIRLNKSVSASVCTDGNVYINDGIASPFVLGLIKPKIYIPSSLSEYEKAYVIAHEYAHIKRRDYLFKPLGYLILSLHWFNPLVWVAYILLCRDIESACDERVIKKMDDKGKKEYSEVLLKLSLPSRKIRACPVAFGEVGVKTRIKGVVNYKKPAFWVCVVAVLLTAVLTVGFLTNPVSAENQDEEIPAYTLEERISEAIVDKNKTEYADSRFCVENYVELKTLTFREDVTAYIWAYYGEYELKDGSVKLAYESYKPAKVKLVETDGSYTLKEYSTYTDKHDTGWIIENFPQELHESVMYTPGYSGDQKSEALKVAKEHFGVTSKDNEFLPVFNAEVLEITEKYITVAPLKGETVSKNTFEKVALSTKKLSSTSHTPFVGDIVRVRYIDIISIDTDPPVLQQVFNLDVIESAVGKELPYVLYSGGEGAYYMKEPVQDKVFVLSSEDVAVWFPGTYFAVNESQNTFMMTYEQEYGSKSKSPAVTIESEGVKYSKYIITGSVFSDGDNILLQATDADWVFMYFEKKGNSYVFNESKSLEHLLWYKTEGFIEEGGKDFPLKNGDTFTLAKGI